MLLPWREGRKFRLTCWGKELWLYNLTNIQGLGQSLAQEMEKPKEVYCQNPASAWQEMQDILEVWVRSASRIIVKLGRCKDVV